MRCARSRRITTRSVVVLPLRLRTRFVRQNLGLIAGRIGEDSREPVPVVRTSEMGHGNPSNDALRFDSYWDMVILSLAEKQALIEKVFREQFKKGGINEKREDRKPS